VAAVKYLIEISTLSEARELAEFALGASGAGNTRTIERGQTKLRRPFLTTRVKALPSRHLAWKVLILAAGTPPRLYADTDSTEAAVPVAGKPMVEYAWTISHLGGHRPGLLVPNTEICRAFQQWAARYHARHQR